MTGSPATSSWPSHFVAPAVDPHGYEICLDVGDSAATVVRACAPDRIRPSLASRPSSPMTA